jgi:hypothetical protein
MCLHQLLELRLLTWLDEAHSDLFQHERTASGLQ